MSRATEGNPGIFVRWQWRDCAKFVCRARRAVPLLREGQIDSESGKNDSASAAKHHTPRR